MKAYTICFVLTIIFTYIAENYFKKGNKKIAIVFSVFAIFIPSFICGVRAVGVGRDIDMYVSPALYFAKNYDFIHYMGIKFVKSQEIGYVIYVYIISFFSKDLNVLLFFIQLIPCLCVYIFAVHYREKIPMWFVMVTYLLTWYLRSYTMMRQSIAVGIVLLSIILFEKKKYIGTVFLFILAFLFHRSAVVAIGLYAICILYNNNRISFKGKTIIFILGFFVLFTLLSTYENILYFFVYKIQILTERFYTYLDSEYANDTYELSITETSFRIIFIVLGLIYLLFNKKRKIVDSDFNKYFLFYIVSLIPFIISFKIVNAERMGYYYIYPGLLYIVPSLTKMFKKDKINQIVSSLLLIFILFVFWFYKYPIKKNCETYPYRSNKIKFLN